MYADRGNGEDGSEEGISNVTTPDGMITIEMTFSPAISGGDDSLPAILPSYQLPDKMGRSRSDTLKFQAVMRAIRVVHLDYTIVVFAILLRVQQFLIRWPILRGTGQHEPTLDQGFSSTVEEHGKQG